MEQRIWSDSHGVRAKGSGSQLQTKTYKKSAPEAEFWEWDLCCDSHCSTELSAASAVELQRSGLFPVLQQEPGQVLPCSLSFSVDEDGFSFRHLPGCVCALLSPGQQRGWAVIPSSGRPLEPLQGGCGRL